jgi:hypothetical protein
MDKFNQTADQFLREYGPPISSSDDEIMVQMKSGKSFGDFLRSLVGKSRKNILDSASFARLYSMNMHGIGGNKNSPNAPEVLLSKFLTKLGDFVNQDVMVFRPRLADSEEFKKKYNYDEYLEREQERRNLFREMMAEKDPEKKEALRDKMHAFRNNSQYAEAMRAQNKIEDKSVDDFHGRPIEQGELVNDDSKLFKDLENMYVQIQQMRRGKIEDQESFLDPEQTKAIEFAQKLSTNAKGGMFGPDPQKEINKAYGQKMIEIANKIKSIKI